MTLSRDPNHSADELRRSDRAADAPGKRPRVLVFSDYFLPGFKAGGPITTLRNMTERLADRADFAIVTRDRDLGDAEPFHGVRPDEWIRAFNAQIYYTSSRTLSIWKLWYIMREQKPDVVYLNSILSRRFSLFPLIVTRLLNRMGGLSPSARIVIAPRGEFSGGALSLKSRRKRAYLAILRASGLWRRVHWQASSAFEAADIAAAVGKYARIRIVPDLLAGVTPEYPRPAKRAGVARIAFVGRISPMKNLDGAIRMIGKLAGEIELDIYGPKEDETYWAQCSAELTALPPNVRARFHGALASDEVVKTLSVFDAMFLPSLGENFGHVIHEALSAGCPPVLSDRTPWRNLESLGIGYDRPLEDSDALVAALQQIIDMDEPVHRQMRQEARRHAARVSEAREVEAATLALFTAS
jgi:glycosyltransferase involved in cell wall biosynthesis